MSGDRRKLSLYLLIFLSQLGATVALPILPDLQQTFAISIATVTLVTAIWGATRLFLDLPLGILVDRLPAGWMLVAGSLMIGGGAVVSAMAPTFEILLLGRVISGAGSAVISIVAMMRLISLTVAEERGRSLGVYQASLQAGSSTGPIFAGVATDLFGWQAAFLVAAVGALAALIVVWAVGGLARSSDDSRPEHGKKPKKAVSPREERGSPLWYYLFLVNLTTFVLFFLTGGVMQSAAPLFAGSLGLSASAIGGVLGVATALRFGVSIAGGYLSDRFSPHSIMLVGFVLIASMLLILPSIDEIWLFALVIWAMSAGRLGNAVPVMMLVERTPAKQQGRWIGINRFVADLALVISPVVVGFMIEHAGFGGAFQLVAAIVGCVIVAMLIERQATRRARARAEAR